MRGQGHGASLRYDLEQMSLPTDNSINLGVVATEWVTNAFKYAYPEKAGEIRVKLHRLPDGRLELAVEDDGIGRSDAAVAKGTGLGSRIVAAMATSMGAEVEYRTRQPGLTASLTFAQNEET